MPQFFPFRVTLLLLVLLAACARPAVTGLSERFEGARVERIFVATQRSLDQLGQIFGEKRSAAMHYAALDISIPPRHRPGRIERASGHVDAARYFAPVAVTPYDNAQGFIRGIGQARAGDGGLLLFVHGYNNTAEDAVFRLAQITHDFGIKEPGLLFSWPSAGEALGYAYDRDSVIFARDGFEQLLRDLYARGQRRILLVAHSMGGYLTMEVLRQIALKGDRHLFSALEGVVLMSPDIDPDVFRQQAMAIGKLPQPFVIMTSQHDTVLSLAGLLTGAKARLGRIEGPDEVKGLDVTVLDFSELQDGGAGGHTVPISSPKAIRLLRGLEDRIRAGDRNLGKYVMLGKDRPVGLLAQ